jgi:hypothetical protein
MLYCSRSVVRRGVVPTKIGQPCAASNAKAGIISTVISTSKPSRSSVSVPCRWARATGNFAVESAGLFLNFANSDV